MLDQPEASSSCRVHQECSSAPSRAAGDGAAGALGTLRDTFTQDGAEGAKSPDKQGRNERRAGRMKLQRVAAEITPTMRVAHCLWTHYSKSVDLVRRSSEGGSCGARFVGVQTCGSVWICPVCSARISEVRRRELQALEDWAREQGHVTMLMTLTARHRGRALDPLVEALAEAKRRLQRRAVWKRLREAGQIVGSVSVREATHGENGWHPHYHVLLVLDVTDENEARELLEPLRQVWLECLRAEGLTGTARRAFDLRGAARVAAYVSKHGRDGEASVEGDGKPAEPEPKGVPGWGMAAEMTQGRNKRGRRGGRSPFQILRDAAEGDEPSRVLWREYANAMHGRRQIVWSNGLKSAVGLGEIEDEKAAEGEAFTEDQDEEVASWSPSEWRRVRHLRAELLAAAEADGARGVERVLAQDDPEADDGEVIDYEPPPKRDHPFWNPPAWRALKEGSLTRQALAAVRRPPDRQEVEDGSRA